jgi:hypothetical protein
MFKAKIVLARGCVGDAVEALLVFFPLREVLGFGEEYGV